MACSLAKFNFSSPNLNHSIKLPSIHETNFKFGHAKTSFYKNKTLFRTFVPKNRTKSNPLSIIRNESRQGSDTPDIKSSKIKVAFFDVDGTITKSNIVRPLLIIQMNELSLFSKLLWLPFFAFQIPFFLLLDKIDRSLFNRVFYLNYGGISVKSKERMGNVVFEKYFFPNIFSRALQRIQDLKKDGYSIVLVTGSLDFLVSPLATFLKADDMITAKLKEENGRFTGELTGNPVSNDGKKLLILEYVQNNDVDLSNCYAFGDSVADLPMLDLVGLPCVINPDAQLESIAKEKNWEIIYW